MYQWFNLRWYVSMVSPSLGTFGIESDRSSVKFGDRSLANSLNILILHVFNENMVDI